MDQKLADIGSILGVSDLDSVADVINKIMESINGNSTVDIRNIVNFKLGDKGSIWAGNHNENFRGFELFAYHFRNGAIGKFGVQFLSNNKEDIILFYGAGGAQHPTMPYSLSLGRSYGGGVGLVAYNTGDVERLKGMAYYGEGSYGSGSVGAFYKPKRRISRLIA